MARKLIRGAAVVTMDPDLPDLRTGDILIDGGKIAAIGPDLGVADAEVIEASGMIAMPGLVNCHIHTWQAGLRGIAVDWTLAEYLRAMHAGLATHFRPADIGIANRMGALHQLHAGTTTIADWCHNNPTPDHTDAAIEGLRASGIRAVFLHGSPKPDPKPGQPHFSEVPMPRAEVERVAATMSPDGLVTLGLAILGPQMSVLPVARQDLQLAQELGLLASMHVSGPLMTPGAFTILRDEGLLGAHVNIVHGNALTEEELDILVGEGASFSLTPEVELQMCFGDPLTRRLHERSGRITLGSDIESAMAGDMFAVTRVALQAARHEISQRHRAETGKPPASMAITTRRALEWATIGGAQMLGLDDRIGSLTPGKQADIILIDARGINMRPVHDPVASILFHGGPRDVDTVLVAGELRKRNGRLVEPALDGLLDQLCTSGNRVLTDFRANWAH